MDEKIQKPKKLKELQKYAKILSSDFCYVRMDFYIIDNEIYFGEYTFTPACCYFNFENEDTDLKLGKMISLPIDKKLNEELI